MLEMLHHEGKKKETQNKTNVQWPKCHCANLILLRSSASKFGAGAFEEQTDYPHQPGDRCWDRVDGSFSPLYREDSRQKHVLLLTQRDVESSVTHIPLCQPLSHTLTHTQSISVEAECQAHKTKTKISTNQIYWAANWSRGFWVLVQLRHSGKAHSHFPI